MPPIGRSSLPPRPPSAPPARPLSLPPPPPASFAPPPLPRFDELPDGPLETVEIPAQLPHRDEPPPRSESPGEPEVSFSYEESEDLELADRISDLELAERISDPDLEITALAPTEPKERKSAPPPPLRARSLPPPPPPTSLPAPSLPQAGVSITPPPPKRARPWWEELFGEDFIRTIEVLTPVQILREATFIEESLGVEVGGTLLDLACGTGRHAVELAGRGYNVVGFDLSATMLARAKGEAEERSQELDFLQGDMRELAFESTFDGIYCWASSFGYFEEEKNLQVIRHIHRALRRGGRFLLDIANRDFVAAQQPRLVWFEGNGCVCIDETNIDFITSRLRVKRTMMLDDGRSRELDYSIRLYALHELGRLLHEAGFRVTEVSGHPATPGVFFGPDSPRLIVLAEKA